MIVSRQEARQIAAGKLEEVVIQGDPPEKGTIEAVRWSATVPAECEVRIRDVWPLEAGGYAVLFSVITYDTPRFMHRQSQKGYTTDVHKALEPVEVPSGWRDRDVQLRAEQQDALERAELANRSPGDQLDAYLAVARASRVDVHDRERKIKREIELLRRDLEDLGGAA